MSDVEIDLIDKTLPTDLPETIVSDSSFIPIGRQLARTPTDEIEQYFELELENEDEFSDSIDTTNNRTLLETISDTFLGKTRSNPNYQLVEKLEKTPPRKQWARYQDLFKDTPSIREKFLNFKKKNRLSKNKSEGHDCENGDANSGTFKKEARDFSERQGSASGGPSKLLSDKEPSRKIKLSEIDATASKSDEGCDFKGDFSLGRRHSFHGEGITSFTSPISPEIIRPNSISERTFIVRRLSNRANSESDICEAVKEAYGELRDSHQMRNDLIDKKDIFSECAQKSSTSEGNPICESHGSGPKERETSDTGISGQVNNTTDKETSFFTIGISTDFPIGHRIHCLTPGNITSDSTIWRYNTSSRRTTGCDKQHILPCESTSTRKSEPNKGETSEYKYTTGTTRICGNLFPTIENNTETNTSTSPPITTSFNTNPSSSSKIKTSDSTTFGKYYTPTGHTTHPTNTSTISFTKSSATSTIRSIPTTATTTRNTANLSGTSSWTGTISRNPTVSTIQSSSINPTVNQGTLNNMSLAQAQTQALASNFTDLHKGQRALTLLLQIPTFSGSPALRFDRWIKQFENVVNMSNWTDDEKVNMLTTKMTDKAYDIVQNILESNTTTYDDLKQLLHDRFHGNETEDYYQKKFDKCERKPLESVLDFAFRLKTIFNRAYPPRPNETINEKAAKLLFLRQKFLQGLEINLRNKIKYKNLQTFEDLVKEAQKYAIRLDADKDEKDKREFINAIETSNLKDSTEIKTIITETVNAVASSFKPNDNLNKPTDGNEKRNQPYYNSNSYRGRGQKFSHQNFRPNYQPNSFRPRNPNNFSRTPNHFRQPFNAQNSSRPSIVYCGYCGYPGHNQGNCNTLRRHQSQTTEIPTTCSNCNEKGHYALMCRKVTHHDRVNIPNQQSSTGNA